MSETAQPEQAPVLVQPAKKAWEVFSMKPVANMRMGDFTPKPFQYYGTYRALDNPVFMLGLPTGTGKTYVSYLVFDYYRNKIPKTKLIVSTKNSAIIQFSKEWPKFFDDHTTVGIIHKDMPRRSGENYAQARARQLELFRRDSDPRDPLNMNLDVLVLGHATTRIEQEKLEAVVRDLKARGYHVIFVLDEATVVKTFNTATHRAVAAISKWCARKIPMTATMSKGKLVDIYMIFRCFGMYLTRNKKEFLDNFCYTVGEGEGAKVIGYKNTRAFVEQLSKISLVLRKRDIAAYLPSFTASYSRVDQDADQIKFINSLLKGEIKLKDKETGLDKDMIGITAVQFQKMALCDMRTHADIWAVDNDYMSPKTQELLTLLDEEYCGERVIIYTPYLRHVHEIVRVLRLKGNQIDPRYAKPLMITGEVGVKEREENRVLFSMKDSRNRVLIVNDAGLEALNLQAANNLLLMTMPRTGGDLIQLAGRISRIDTTHTNLNIRYMIHNNSQDEDDYATIMQQAAIIARVNGGEPEPGLVDLELLKSAGRLTDEKAKYMMDESAEKVMLHEKRSRIGWYAKAAASIKDAA